jgi:hypothetical protein
MMEWINCSDSMPPVNFSVLAFVSDYYGGGHSRTIRAHWIPKLTVEVDEDYEGGDYCEERDMYYIEEGWYEQNCYEDINWRVSDKVTHWMRLPPPPVSIQPTTSERNDQEAL